MNPETQAQRDQALAILRDAGGPLTAKQVAKEFPRQRGWPTCGHGDCTEPRHQSERWYVGLHNDEAHRLLAALEKKGLVRRAGKSWNNGPNLWVYVSEEERAEIAALEEAFKL